MRSNKYISLPSFLFISLVAACLLLNITSAVALLLGLVYTLLFKNPFEKITSQSVGWILKVAVVGLGFGMNITETLSTGRDGMVITLGILLLIAALTFIFIHFFKFSKITSYLIAVGTAICGGSAIAAVAPVVRANKDEISISLGVVFMLNAVALLIFPSIGHFFGLSQFEFGVWSGIAIHDTSSVLGAANEYGSEALKTATIVKMSRVLWIIPISFLSIFIFKGKDKKSSKPWFILLFVVAILVNTYLPLPVFLNDTIIKSSRSLLVLSLFLIGTGISISNIKKAGIKPVGYGIILWTVVSVVVLVTVKVAY